jgi:nucleotide-binding universal stress UspA family protein
MSNASAPRNRSFVLVVALDLADTDSGGFAFDQALRIALRIPDSQVHVLHVSVLDAKQETLGQLRLYVSEKVAALGAAQQRLGIHVRKGEPAREIAQLAAEVMADLIVVGTHKPLHMKKLFVGSTAEKVMANVSCPVVVAGPRPKPQPSHVIVIEPPCPDCLRARIDSQGRTWWCARHSEHHAVLQSHHIYSYHSEIPFTEHDSSVSSTGVD